MKSIRRCQHIITIFLLIFIAGMAALVIKINREAPFYMMNSDHHELGMVYDRNGEVLFDGQGTGQYPDNYFLDVGNLIGDDKGQMENTLVARNIKKLNNYSFSEGLLETGGQAAIYTTLDHYANRAVYDAYAGARGCTVAYNYKTGEILVCASVPSVDVTKGYADIANFESGTLISKAMYGTVPGSTQKVSTVITAMESLGRDRLLAKSYNCVGRYLNANGDYIDCHNVLGHGTLNLQQAVENSCNPYFAQLVSDPDLPLENIIQGYRRMGYAVNDDKEEYFNIDGIICEKASTTLVDKNEFRTQWGCIGQGDTLVSPVQLMMWQSAVANGTGKMTMPHLIDRVFSVHGNITQIAKTKYGDKICSEETAQAVRQILLTNGSNNYSVSIAGYNVGVKSGTAQVKEGAEENSLLVGFLDDARHPIAFCILIENMYSTTVTTEQLATVLLNALCS
ncbi:MAG: ABC transporter permease [Ruminococcus sp.]|nr:ABC transporter permease [Ruminococcus sp.]